MSSLRKRKCVMVCHAHKPRDFSLRVGKKTKNRSALDRFVGRTLDLGGSEKRETGFGPATFSLARSRFDFWRRRSITAFVTFSFRISSSAKKIGEKFSSSALGKVPGNEYENILSQRVKCRRHIRSNYHAPFQEVLLLFWLAKKPIKTRTRHLCSIG